MSQNAQAVDSIAADLTTANAGSATTVLNLSSGQSFDMTDYDLGYSSAATTDIGFEIWDAPSGTTAANLAANGTLVAYIPGIVGDHTVAANINRREFDDSVIVNQPSGQDGEAWLTIGGYYVSI